MKAVRFRIGPISITLEWKTRSKPFSPCHYDVVERKVAAEFERALLRKVRQSFRLNALSL